MDDRTNAYIEKVVSEAPPLSGYQRERLRVLLSTSDRGSLPATERDDLGSLREVRGDE